MALQTQVAEQTICVVGARRHDQWIGPDAANGAVSHELLSLSQKLGEDEAASGIEHLLDACPQPEVVDLRLVLEALAVDLGKSFDGGGARTISWLRRAAAAGLLFAAAQMVTVLIQMLVLMPLLYRAALGNDVSVYIPEGEMLAGLFLASAAWVVAFALEEGRRKQDELAGYV